MMTETPPQEKRSQTRAITDVALEVYDMSTHELVGVARLLNMSTEGACVATTSLLSGRESLFIRMLLNNRLVAMPVELLWERSALSTHEYGLKFGTHSEEMQETLGTFMKDNIEFYQDTDLSLSPPPADARRS